MTKVQGQVTIVCKFNSKNDIVPVKYRVKMKNLPALTYPVTEVKGVRYGMYQGDLSIIYNCMAVVEDDEKECIIRFNTEMGNWDLIVA